MVVGEEILIGKGIDALIKWFNKRKADKELVHNILMELKIAINNVILHMDLCKEHGYIKYSKLQIYLPSDIENINQLLIKYGSKLDLEFYNELQKFLRYLIKYNEFISSLYLGAGKKLQEYEENIRSSIKTFTDKLDELIKEIEK